MAHYTLRVAAEGEFEFGFRRALSLTTFRRGRLYAHCLQTNAFLRYLVDSPGVIYTPTEGEATCCDTGLIDSNNICCSSGQIIQK